RLLHMVEQMKRISRTDARILAQLLLMVTQTLLIVLEIQRMAMKFIRVIRRLLLRHWSLIVAVVAVGVAVAPRLLENLIFLLDNLPITSAFAISTTQIAIQASLIQADWFQPDAPELAPGVAVAKANGEDAGVIECQDGEQWQVKLTSPRGKQAYLASSCKLEIQSSKFLWICHRSDYREKFFYGSEDVSREDLENVLHQLDDINFRLDRLTNTLGQKLDVAMRLISDEYDSMLGE
ncbi:unnamed protein product, partial [Symbiodinium pilosum]